jgi:hypothetical protein
MARMTPANKSNRAALALHTRNRRAVMAALVATTTAVFRCRVSGLGTASTIVKQLAAGSGCVLVLLIAQFLYGHISHLVDLGDSMNAENR